MQAAHFYRNTKNNINTMRRTAKSRPDVPRLTSTAPAPVRGRGRGRGMSNRTVFQSVPTPPPNHDNLVDDSDKENENEDEQLDNLHVQNNRPHNAIIEEDETQADFEWKCKLLEILQQYPEVYDLAHPRYKDKDFRDQAWDEIATGMDATGNLLNISPCRSILYQIYAKFSVKGHTLIIFSSL